MSPIATLLLNRVMEEHEVEFLVFVAAMTVRFRLA